MSRIQPVTPEKAPAETKEVYATIEQKMGKVLNIFQNMGNSLPVLKGFLALNEAANQTKLTPKLREQIALVVSQANDCNYCLSAHSAVAHATGFKDKEILDARKGQGDDPKSQAILTFAKTVIDKKGNVTDQDVNALKATGVSDAEIVDIILIINITMFTNYFNHITDPKIDFPVAPKL